MEKLKLSMSSPWVTFVHEMEVLFSSDGEVHLRFDEEENILKLFVDEPVKANALTQLLPEEKEFGNVVLKISVIPSNIERTKADLIKTAFRGNDVLRYIYKAPTPFGQIDYVVLKNEVVQFFNDQMDDINGNKSTLYQEIAKDVFGGELGVYFCTDTNNLCPMKPLGEWP